MTVRHKILASKLVENGGNIGKAMIASGYSSAMARNPQKVIKSKGFQKLLEKIIPDNKLIELNSRLLDSFQISNYRFPATLSDQDIRKIIESSPETKVLYIKKENGYKNCLYSTPDNSVRLNALNLVYRLHGLYQKQNVFRAEENNELENEAKRVSKLLSNSIQ